MDIGHGGNRAKMSLCFYSSSLFVSLCWLVGTTNNVHGAVLPVDKREYIFFTHGNTWWLFCFLGRGGG